MTCQAITNRNEVRAIDVVDWTLELIDELNVAEVVARDGGWVGIYGITQRGTYSNTKVPNHRVNS